MRAMRLEPTKFRLANRRNSTIGALTRSSTRMKAASIRTDPANSARTDTEPQPQELPSIRASTSAVKRTGERHHAGVVDLAPNGGVARLADGEQRRQHGADAHRKVNEEDLPPRDGLGEEPAEYRADRQREGRDAGPRADRLAAL